MLEKIVTLITVSILVAVSSVKNASAANADTKKDKSHEKEKSGKDHTEGHPDCDIGGGRSDHFGHDTDV